MGLTARQLGDAGEAHSVELLRARGYSARLLPTNNPTYDIEAARGSWTFLVSVKVSRDKQHVRLGSRKAVARLAEGNFIFAYLPRPGGEIRSFTDGSYTLLILPADLVQTDSLPIHDAYWAARGKEPNFSVMVKGYGAHHKEIWPRWLKYEDAWGLLP